MKILTIDSGANAGWALFTDRQLTQCGLGEVPAPCLVGVSRIVIERPHVGQTRSRKKDIITLAIRAGEVGGVLRYLTKVKPEYIEPNRWKGSTSKKIANDRAMAKLTAEETQTFQRDCKKVAKGKLNNVEDAIGIGLYACDRY